MLGAPSDTGEWDDNRWAWRGVLASADTWPPVVTGIRRLAAVARYRTTVDGAPVKGET